MPCLAHIKKHFLYFIKESAFSLYVIVFFFVQLHFDKVSKLVVALKLQPSRYFLLILVLLNSFVVKRRFLFLFHLLSYAPYQLFFFYIVFDTFPLLVLLAAHFVSVFSIARIVFGVALQKSQLYLLLLE